jgi:chromosome segregation ATPase
MDTRITLIRDSISEMTTINPTAKYTFGSDKIAEEIKEQITKEYDEKINSIKKHFTEQIQLLLNESQKEKEKYNSLIKEKERDIKKLLEDRKTIKEQIAKQYEKELMRFNLTINTKDSEIEKLKTQLKNFERKLEALKK